MACDVTGVGGHGRRSSVSLDIRLGLSVVKQAPLFSGVSPRCREEIASLARAVYFRRRDRLLEQGERLDDVMVVGAGCVKITVLSVGGEEVILRLVGPGKVVAGLDQDGCHSSTVGVEALESGHALVWKRHSLEELFDRAPILHRNALHIFAELLHGMEERYRELSTERVPVRLARTLLRLRDEVGRPKEDGVALALSREDLALMVGATVFTVSRLLSRWEAAGTLRGRRESVVVVERAGLLALAGDPESRLPSWT